jgi:hypothetical protein
MVDFIERHAEKIAGVLSCLDRVVITGTLPDICHSEAATRFLFNQGIRIFDYTKFAEPLRDQIRSNAEGLASAHGLTIEFLRNHTLRKEDRVQEILAQRGRHPGLVPIFSAMEACPSFEPWHDKTTHKTFLKPKDGKCLHYYFDFLDPMLGLCYLRVPTWAPFRLQFDFNGHNLLAHKLDLGGIGYRMIDNAFVSIDDWGHAQALAKTISVPTLHRTLDQLARTYCPVIAGFRSGVHWSLMQVEYATDLIFHKQDVLRPLYEALSRTAIHAVKCEQVATFLGHRLSESYEGAIGNDFRTRLEGTRIKHYMGPAAIKMYDKFALVLRVETTCNDVTFFKHHRRVEHRDGSWEMKLAAMKKSIYSLPDLMGLLEDANRRYLEFLGALDDPTAGVKRLEKIAEPVHDDGRSHRGFTLFAGDDLDLFQAISRGQFTISGFRNRDLREWLPGRSVGQLGRMIKRLRAHGLLKKIGKRYKYYLTKLGRTVVTTALKLRELLIIPSLNEPATV